MLRAVGLGNKLTLFAVELFEQLMGLKFVDEDLVASCHQVVLTIQMSQISYITNHSYFLWPIQHVLPRLHLRTLSNIDPLNLIFNSESLRLRKRIFESLVLIFRLQIS